MSHRFLQLTLLFGVVTLLGCGADPTTVNDSTSSIHDALKPPLSNRVATVSYALQYLTQRVAGPNIEVDFTVGHRPSDQNWQPSEQDVAVLQKADLVVTNGPGAVYANWLARVSVSDSKICNSCIDLATRDFIMVADHKIVHQHGPEGEHSHPYMVAYTWLDPRIAKKQAKKIKADLSRTYPDRADEFDQNFNALARDLDELANLFHADYPDSPPIVVSINPSLKFFSRAANVSDQHLLWFEKGDVSMRRQLEDKLAEIRKSDPRLTDHAVVFLIQNEGDYAINEVLGDDFERDFGLIRCSIDTLDRAPATGDYLSVMKSNIEELRSSIRQSTVEQAR